MEKTVKYIPMLRWRLFRSAEIVRETYWKICLVEIHSLSRTFCLPRPIKITFLLLLSFWYYKLCTQKILAKHEQASNCFIDCCCIAAPAMPRSVNEPKSIALTVAEDPFELLSSSRFILLLPLFSSWLQSPLTTFYVFHPYPHPPFPTSKVPGSLLAFFY